MHKKIKRISWLWFEIEVDEIIQRTVNQKDDFDKSTFYEAYNRPKIKSSGVEIQI